jgi:hypothetical protein
MKLINILLNICKNSLVVATCLLVISVCAVFIYLFYSIGVAFTSSDDANGTTIKQKTEQTIIYKPIQEKIYTENYKKNFLRECYEYNSLSYCKNIYNSITEKK